MMFSQRVGFFPPAATVSPFVGSEITTTTNILYPYTQYTTSSLAYVGPDTSQRPIFLFIFVEPGTGILKGQAFRINNDGTIFQGTTATLDNNAGGGAHTVALTSEYQGAGSFGNQQSANGRWWCSYTKPATQQLMAVFGTVQLNQAGLTVVNTRAPLHLSFGNTDGDFPVAAFLGRRPPAPAPNGSVTQFSVLFGMRTGSGFVTKRYWTDSASAFAAQGPAEIPNGGQTDSAALGFAGDFSNLYVPRFRSAYWNTGGGGQTTVSAVMSSEFSNTGNPVAANYRTEIVTSPSILDTSTYNQACNLNATNKFLGVSYISPNSLNLTVVDVTWNTPPSFPTTNVGAFVSAGLAGATQPAVVSGFNTDSAFLVQSPVGATSLTSTPITVAGTVPTVGSTETLFGGLSNCQGPPILATGKIGTKTYMAGIQSRSGSNTPYVFGVRFT